VFVPKSRSKLKIRLRNQNQFDLDGYASVPLLDPTVESRYRAYRAAYTHLLLVWNLPIAMCEVRKFDGLPSYFAKEPSDVNNLNGGGVKGVQPGHSLLSLGADRGREGVLSSRTSATRLHDGLRLQHHCPQCGGLLSAIEKNGIAIAWQCPQCSGNGKVGQRMVCVVCEALITGLYVPCLNCRHVGHFDCQREWFEEEDGKDDDGGATTCASGCDCVCSDHWSVAGPWPHETGDDVDPELDEETEVENEARERRFSFKRLSGPLSKAATIALTNLASNAPSSEASGRDSHDGDWADVDADPWLNTQYASFAKGVGGGLSRGLSNRSSQATMRKRSQLGRSETLD